MRGTGGVKKHWTGGVEERGIRPDEEHEQGVETQRRVRCGLKKNLELSLRGNVEIQAQHWPDRLHKPRTGSGWTDRLGPDRCVNKRLDRCVNWKAVGQIFHEGIYLGISVGAHL